MHNDDLAKLLEVQHKKLLGFRRDFLPSLSYAQSLEYLQVWEKKTSNAIEPLLGGSERHLLQNVWLSQKFELSQDEQIHHLLQLFEEKLKELIEKYPPTQEQFRSPKSLLNKIKSIFKRSY